MRLGAFADIWMENSKENLMATLRTHAHSCMVALPLIIITLVLAKPGAMAQSAGVSDTEIRIGQSCALTGQAQLLGKGMRDGARVYFRQVNAAGGINGRKIRLITMDDGHASNASIVNTKRLIEDENVFLLFGYVGAAPSKAALEIAQENSVPFFGSMSGAAFLREPVNRYMFNLRASDAREIEALIQKLVQERGAGKFAAFYADNPVGQVGLKIIRAALQRQGQELVSTVNYASNTLAVEPAGQELLAVQPDTVLLIGAAAPCAKLIIMMRNWGSDAVFAATSSVGSEALGIQLANKGLGVTISQVVPFPYDRRVPLVAEYQTLTGEFGEETETGFVGLEGFMAAKALCTILKNMGNPITRDGFITAAESQRETDLGGIKITFRPDNHQGVNDVFFTQVVPGGFIKPIANFSDLYN